MPRKIRFPWSPLRWTFYDCEIQSCIPQYGEEKDPQFEYCDGWDDHANMGISAIATYSNWDGAFRVFSQYNAEGFQELINKSDRIIGFNSKSFDDKLCIANNIKIQTSYDLLAETWLAAGMPEVYTPGVTRSGYKLENLARANFNIGKFGTGELAPMLYQQGKVEAVEAYCLTDVYLSVRLLWLGWDGQLIDPTSGDKLQLRPLV